MPNTENEFHSNLVIRDLISDLISEIEDADIDRSDKHDAINEAIRQLQELKEQL